MRQPSGIKPSHLVRVFCWGMNLNKFIAEAFSVLLAFFHIGAILVFTFVAIAEKPWQQDRSTLITYVLIAVGYVFATGLISTFAAINEHLVDLKQSLDSMSQSLGDSVDSIKNDVSEVKDSFEEVKISVEEMKDCLQSMSSHTEELRDEIIHNVSEVTSNLAESSRALANSVTALNRLVDQDWFRKAILR